MGDRIAFILPSTLCAIIHYIRIKITQPVNISTLKIKLFLFLTSTMCVM